VNCCFFWFLPHLRYQGVSTECSGKR